MSFPRRPSIDNMTVVEWVERIGYSSTMTTIVDAIYENGKLVLQEPLPLPEHSHVRVTVESDLERADWLMLSEESLRKVWDNDADDIFNELLDK